MTIPCIINNFNQLEFLTTLVAQLSKFDQLAIYILDNNSTYLPLLNWYDTLKRSGINVIRFKKNLGHHAPWKSGLTYQLAWKHKSSYYMVTDPDLDIANVPGDMIEMMTNVLNNKDVFKVGLSLEINDIPEHYPAKKAVQDWEAQNWQQNKIEPYQKTNLYKVGIDTTLAMYNIIYTELVKPSFLRPSYIKFNCNFIDSAFRLDRPYTARHLPWYLDFKNLSENQKFYLDSCKRSQVNPTSWTLLADKNQITR